MVAARLELLQQLAHAANSARLDAISHFAKAVVIRHLRIAPGRRPGNGLLRAAAFIPTAETNGCLR
jgi:hypothetical protein